MPPPEPRSSTISPGFNSASAVGLPQPSDAFSASSGTSPACPASYKLDVIGSQQLVARGALLQHPPWPVVTRKAAWLYFSRTTSFTLFDAVMTHSFR